MVHKITIGPVKDNEPLVRIGIISLSRCKCT